MSDLKWVLQEFATPALIALCTGLVVLLVLLLLMEFVFRRYGEKPESKHDG